MKASSGMVSLGTTPGGYMESQSGLQRSKPQVYGRYIADPRTDIAFILFHPTSNFHGHYLLDPLAALGGGVLALNTRYVGNDSMLLMERALQDVGAGMRFLREQGYRRIVMLGNSGGGSLASLYQEQATAVTINSTPDGRPFKLEASELPKADALALVAAHPGRAHQLLAKIDPSVLDETDSPAIDATLDMFNPDNGPPFPASWLACYKAGQKRRLDRITDGIVRRIAALDAARPAEAADDAFIIRRTQADPRTGDLAIDTNDRPLGTLGGEARLYNEAANGLARFCTLRSFLSQWSPTHSRADGPRCLERTHVPILIVNYTADQTVFPSQVREWERAAGNRGTRCDIVGAPHYLLNRPEESNRVAGLLMDWGR